MTEFLVYMNYVGKDNYQMFIKNNSFESDYIRIIVGYTEIIKVKRTGEAVDSWIISPLQSTGEHVFIQSVNKRVMKGKRLWAAFEAFGRSKPKNTLVGSFIALSPTGSKWRKTIGSTTQFGIKTIDSIKSLENTFKIPQNI